MSATLSKTWIVPSGTVDEIRNAHAVAQCMGEMEMKVAMTTTKKFRGRFLVAPTISFVLATANCLVVDARQDEPATAKTAATLLDLRTFPVPEDAELVSPRRLANLSYQTAAALSDAVAFAKDGLQKAGWKELPGGYSDAQYASGTFFKEGFHASLTAAPATSDDGKPRIGLNLVQHGNIDFEKIPKPADLQKLYAGPVSIILLSPASVEDARTQCSEALLKAGWITYSGADDGPRFFKRNAIRLTVFVVAAPAQQNKTSVTYSAELMSVELDPPPESTLIHYADSITSLNFDSKLSIDDVVAFYRKQLESLGWQATTDKPIKISLYDTLFFRNKAMDMLTLELNTVDDISRGRLQFQTAAEVEELEKAAEAQAEQKAERAEQMDRERAASKIAVPIPHEASEVEATGDRLEFQLPSGKSLPTIKALRKFFADAGWKEEVVSESANAAVFNFTLKEARVELLCVDPGIIPAEFTLSGSGVTLEKK